MSQSKEDRLSSASIHGTNPISGFTIINQALQQPGGSTHLPLQNIKSSSSISQQTSSGFPITVPIHKNSLSLLTQQQITNSTSIMDGKKVQLQISDQCTNNNKKTPDSISKVVSNDICTSGIMSQDLSKKPVQLKLHNIPTIPIQNTRPIGNISNASLTVSTSGNNVQVVGPINLHVAASQVSKTLTQTSSISNQSQCTTTTSGKSAPQMIYIQTPTGLKPVPTTEIVPANTVRLPVSSGGVQFMSTMGSKTSCVKSSVGKPPVLTRNLSPQPIIIQKPKMTPQNIVPIPVSSTPNTSGKHTFAAYVSAIKKPPSVVKPQDSQKVIITPMNVPKVQNKLMFPTLASKGPYINFQIANGQLQNDTQGNVTVMQDSIASSNSTMPPLQPITSVDAISNQSSISNIIIDSKTSDNNSFTTSIPGSRAEQIGEQEYTLSIPDNNCIGDDVITVSISDENEENHQASYTINIPEKSDELITDNKSRIIECSRQLMSSSIPTILRRSNSDDNDQADHKKMVFNVTNDHNDNDIENKIEKAKKKLFNKSYSILNKPIHDKEETNPAQSLYCEEKLDHENDSKNIEVEAIQSVIQNNDQITIIPNIPQISKDRRKSRVSTSDTYLQSEPIIIDKGDITFDEDSLGFQWHNDVALLKGSYLQFRTNEFGLIDVIDSVNDIKSSLPKYNTPLKQRISRDGAKKPTSPEDLYCCDGCGCHGMAAEFITPNFCSHTCQRNYDKDNPKDKNASDLKKKRKSKKSILMKSGSKDQNTVLNFNKVGQKEKNSLESLSSDITVKVIPHNQQTVYPKNSKWKHIEGFNWNAYLDWCNARSAPEKLFRPFTSYKHGFKPGMKVEAMDPVHKSLFTVVSVSEIQGFRLKLHFDGYRENYDFWVNADSCDIFPPGWCEKNGKVLIPPKGYTPDTFSWAQYVKQAKAILAPRGLFAHVSSTNVSPNGFKAGMKLEAEDRKNSLTCVATIADVLDNRLLIHFDSWDDIYDYWVQPNSPYIHPTGWCDKHGYSLTPPDTYKDPENFSWDVYLKETKSVPVPARSFKPRLPNNFAVGMKLEAVDKRVPFLIRVATVSEVRGYQIRISFDGMPNELSYWVDDDSPDIYPVGWCLNTGHPLEPPLAPEEIGIPGPCGVLGCFGLGNILGGKDRIHKTFAECPYRLPPKSPEISDRLAYMLPPPFHSEPRTKEPKRAQRGRPMKVKRSENDNKQETASDDDSNSSASKRRRVASPMSQETVERSVFEPGYTPNPNWNAPPTWGLASHCMPLDDILQRLSLRTDPRNWSQTDVQEFVENIAKSREVSWRFCKQRIDGESFLMLAQEDLVSILGMRLGPAIKIYNSIIQLRKKIVV